MYSLPIPVFNLCCAISGANISSQHLKSGCFSCSVHSQQTKALKTISHFLETVEHFAIAQLSQRSGTRAC